MSNSARLEDFGSALLLTVTHCCCWKMHLPNAEKQPDIDSNAERDQDLDVEGAGKLLLPPLNGGESNWQALDR